MAAFWARPLCHLIFGRSFEHSVAVLQCLSPLPFLFGLNSVFGTQTMLVFDMDAIFSKIMLLSAAVAVPITIALSVSFGAVGAAAASVTVAALTVSAMVFALRSTGMRIWLRPPRQFSTFAQTSGAAAAEE
jgi:PST family polysaccharide transporter